MTPTCWWCEAIVQTRAVSRSYNCSMTHIKKHNITFLRSGRLDQKWLKWPLNCSVKTLPIQPYFQTVGLLILNIFAPSGALLGMSRSTLVLVRLPGYSHATFSVVLNMSHLIVFPSLLLLLTIPWCTHYTRACVSCCFLMMWSRILNVLNDVQPLNILNVVMPWHRHVSDVKPLCKHEQSLTHTIAAWHVSKTTT